MDNVLAFGIDGTMRAARHREAAGRFHLGHAIALCAAGEVQLARGAFEALSAVWPGRKGTGA